MEKSISSVRQPSSGQADANDLGGHTLFWWSLKGICATALIAALLLGAIYQLNPWFNFPIRVAQALVLIGAISTLWHYLKLKRSTNDISKPQTLVHQSGLFGLIRHPMYLSDVFVSCGLFLLFPTIATLPVLALGIMGVMRQAKIEDDYMQRLFPVEFNRWKQNTKLIFPLVY